MKFYYASPEPDRLPAELRAIANRGVPEEHTHLVVATFLGLVMKAHPERIASWFTELGDLEGIWRTTCIWPCGARVRRRDARVSCRPG
jgi:hypothetical protein